MKNKKRMSILEPNKDFDSDEKLTEITGQQAIDHNVSLCI